MDQQPRRPTRRQLLVNNRPVRRPTRRQLLWAAGIVGVVALLVLIRLGYVYQGTGFGQSKVSEEIRPAKTLWDWLELLIIPILLAIGGFLFTRSENRATEAAAERRAQEEALQAYLDQMGQLLLDKDQPLRQSDNDSEVRTLARARTLTTLPRVNGDLKASLVHFLYESGLITKDRVVDLNGADLSGARLLGEANLSEADLQAASLLQADLSLANLSKAYVTNGTLEYQQALSFEGATMPNGQKYEDWLRSKGRGEDGANSGPS